MATAGPAIGSLALYASASVLADDALVDVLLALTVAQTAGSLFAAPLEAQSLATKGLIKSLTYRWLGFGSVISASLLLLFVSARPILAFFGGLLSGSTFFLRCSTTFSYDRMRLSPYLIRNAVEAALKVCTLAASIFYNSLDLRSPSAEGLIFLFVGVQVVAIRLSNLLVRTSRRGLTAGSRLRKDRKRFAEQSGISQQLVVGVLSLLHLTLVSNMLASAEYATGGVITASFVILRAPSILATLFRPSIISQDDIAKANNAEVPKWLSFGCLFFAVAITLTAYLVPSPDVNVVAWSYMLGCTQPLVLLRVYGAIRDSKFSKAVYLAVINVLLICAEITLFGLSTPALFLLVVITLALLSWFD